MIKIRRWKEYFEKMINESVSRETNQRLQEEENSEKMVEEPTVEEVIKIIKNLKNGKSPRENELAAELIKYGEEKRWKEMFKIIQKYG